MSSYDYNYDAQGDLEEKPNSNKKTAWQWQSMTPKWWLIDQAMVRRLGEVYEHETLKVWKIQFKTTNTKRWGIDQAKVHSLYGVEWTCKISQDTVWIGVFWEIHSKSNKLGWRLLSVYLCILRVLKLINSHLDPNTYVKTLSLQKFLPKPPWELKVMMEHERWTSMEFVFKILWFSFNKVWEFLI